MTENTRVQSVYSDDNGQLTLGEVRGLVDKCAEMDDEALVYGSDVLSGTIMDLPEMAALAVVEKTST